MSVSEEHAIENQEHIKSGSTLGSSFASFRVCALSAGRPQERIHAMNRDTACVSGSGIVRVEGNSLCL